ncbi:MFS transporter [Brachybacterium saurashtrense]|uniref:MFS transporter n=2 Tax=Brachybacterium saurashtrense TaxID=556288 RepID=A0A345YTH7_9MICO|nr:MFS transporter [Brachybacterium saurashtrense]RRR24926.1 MFS transporter [Brachybacterium saurashtrense]
MLVLDDSIVNIALPSIQTELAVSPTHLPWVVNAYILAFGALLLLGGRIGDLWGRKRTLQLGLAIFVLASLAGGFGQSTEMLIIARAVQGLGAALASPNALALITTTFADRTMRDTALSLYGAMTGFGIILGLLLGGVLTGTLGWRWVFFINVPIGILALVGTRTLVGADRHPGRLGTIDAILGTGGMVALVYAITRFGESGLADPLAIVLIATAAVMLTIFIAVQSRSRNPLVPLSLFRDRNRTGAYLTMLLMAIGPMGTFYILTLHLQQVEQYTPLMTGIAWLPFAAGIFVGAGTTPKLLLRIAPRYVVTGAALLGAGATFWFSRITTETDYWLHLAPAMFLLAIGFGGGAIALTQAAIYRVDSDKAGIASALLNSAQQIGVALGLALLAGVAATVTAETGGTTPQTLVDGYTTALVVATGVLIAAAIIAFVMLSTRSNTEDRADVPSPAA